MTRRYPASDEERLRMQAHLRAWADAGLLDASQRERFEAELYSDLRRANLALRLGLAAFTCLGVAASVLFVNVFFRVSSPFDATVTPVAIAVVCLSCAEVLSGRYRFYRHGVEEALAICAAALVSIGASQLPQLFRHSQSVAAAGVGTAAFFGVYRRYGLVYAAVVAMAFAAAIPFTFDLDPRTALTLAAGILAVCFQVARTKRTRGEEWLADEYGTLQAAAAIGVYLAINLHVPGWLSVVIGASAAVRGWFYWWTYAATWLWPAVILRLGIRGKDRKLIDVGAAMALVTLLTTKPYLGWPSREWDPILLGLLLIATAAGMRRWLTGGPLGERGGFSAARRGSNDAWRTAMRVGALGFQPAGSSQPAEPSSSAFGGGRSGGGGAGAAF